MDFLKEIDAYLEEKYNTYFLNKITDWDIEENKKKFLDIFSLLAIPLVTNALVVLLKSSVISGISWFTDIITESPGNKLFILPFSFEILAFLYIPSDV